MFLAGALMTFTVFNLLGLFAAALRHEHVSLQLMDLVYCTAGLFRLSIHLAWCNMVNATPVLMQMQFCTSWIDQTQRRSVHA